MASIFPVFELAAGGGFDLIDAATTPVDPLDPTGPVTVQLQDLYAKFTAANPTAFGLPGDDIQIVYFVHEKPAQGGAFLGSLLLYDLEITDVRPNGRLEVTASMFVATDDPLLTQQVEVLAQTLRAVPLTPGPPDIEFEIRGQEAAAKGISGNNSGGINRG